VGEVIDHAMFANDRGLAGAHAPRLHRALLDAPSPEL